MTHLKHYCGVCQRETTSEARPFHRHIACYYSWRMDTTYLAMPDSTAQLLCACMEAQDAESQVILDHRGVSQEVGEMEASRLACLRLLKQLALPAETPLSSLLDEAARRLESQETC
jgi:hypothetical protein